MEIISKKSDSVPHPAKSFFFHAPRPVFSLQKSLPPDLFRGVRFAMFSLGDRAYGPLKFCAAGRRLTVRLRQLGAALLTDPGFGDDGTGNGGVFADLDEWLEAALLPKLRRLAATTTATNDASATLAAIIATTTAGVAAPPYRVTVAQRDPCAIDRAHGEEWQREEYNRAYCEFFETQRPLSAYHYGDHGQRRMLDGSCRGASSSSFALLLASVVENRRITAADWEQNTRHIRIVVEAGAASPGNDVHSNSLSSSTESLSVGPLPYRAGDVAAIMPANSTKDVDAFLSVLPTRLREIADCALAVQFDPSRTDVNRFPGVGYAHWPDRCTLRGWLTYCADIHALPEREDLRALAMYCSDGSPHGREHREKLLALSETKSSALYVDYVLREKRNWVDVLFDFDSLRDSKSLLTVEALFGVLSPIRPREFSIASSPTKDRLARQSVDASKREGLFGVELCVALVEGSTRLGRSFHGLCSHFLALLPASSDEEKSLVRLWIRPGSFHGLPLQCDKNDARSGHDRSQIPVLCIGAGTGIAPLRALTQERVATGGPGAPLPLEQNVLERDDILVFGCRMKAADFYYEEEWIQLQQAGRLALLVAFSRDQWHKVYVQQVLSSADYGVKQLCRHILDRKGAIYIAGGPKMARAVKEVIVEALGSAMEGGEKEALQLLSKLQRAGRFSVEAWN